MLQRPFAAETFKRSLAFREDAQKAVMMIIKPRVTDELWQQTEHDAVFESAKRSGYLHVVMEILRKLNSKISDSKSAVMAIMHVVDGIRKDLLNLRQDSPKQLTFDEF